MIWQHLTRRPFTQPHLPRLYRRMSTQKHLFVVWAPDYEGAYEQRMKVRPDHLVGARQAEADGILRVGGGMLSPESLTGGERKLVGSMLLYEAESIEVVREQVEKDVYYKNPVWDKSKIVILPFVAAVGDVKFY